jgi:hypothetical protein
MFNADIAAKCVEISKCLIDKETGFHDYYLLATNTIGNAARLAANLRQRGTLSYEELGGVSQVLKQNFALTLNSSIPLLKELNWIHINKDNKNRYIQEFIPPIQDVLGVLGGEVWENKDPTEIDVATIESLSLLKNNPITQEELLSDTSVSEMALTKALEYGKELDYFGDFYSSDKEKIIWTPFYWPEKSDKILKYLKRQTYPEFAEIEIIATKLSSAQGMPIEHLGSSNLVNAGIGCGFFPSVGIIGGNRVKHEYVFKASPNLSINPDSDIFEKARQIVACVRHGQYHAEHSKIKYPIYILKALRENRLGAHSYAKIQYAQLLINGTCKYEEIDAGYTKKYKIIFIDTEENKIAMNIAEELLQGYGHPISSIHEPDVDNLISQGVYNFTSEQRQIKNKKRVGSPDTFQKLIEIAQGRSW